MLFLLIFLTITGVSILLLNTYSSYETFGINEQGNILPIPIVNEKNLNSKGLQPSQIPQWNVNGKLISNAAGNQRQPQICCDGAGGAIITWYDTDIYAQRVDADGDLLWGSNGIIVCNRENTQDKPQICSDGAGGAIIVWQDMRSGTNYDIGVQKISANGSPKWGDNGTIICNDMADQLDPQICSDGSGGAIIAWHDDRYDEMDIFVQKVDTNGIPKWDSNGIIVCNADYGQYDPQICSDDAGGAIITWYDARSGLVFFAQDIYAQRIDTNGVPKWVDNGTIICNEDNDQWSPQICSDGAGGAIITWYDERIVTDRDIYAQKIDLNGITKWVDNGTLICNRDSDQNEPQLCTDDSGGAIITWYDVDIYAQNINASGVIKWRTNGTVICNASNAQNSPQICKDNAGGAIITWYDLRNGNDDIYAQKINASGNIEWQKNGTLICNADDNQYYPELCSDGSHGAIIVWEDGRSSSNTDIYAQKINENPIDESSQANTLFQKAFQKAFLRAINRAILKVIARKIEAILQLSNKTLTS